MLAATGPLHSGPPAGVVAVRSESRRHVRAQQAQGQREYRSDEAGVAAPGRARLMAVASDARIHSRVQLAASATAHAGSAVPRWEAGHGLGQKQEAGLESAEDSEPTEECGQVSAALTSRPWEPSESREKSAIRNHVADPALARCTAIANPHPSWLIADLGGGYAREVSAIASAGDPPGCGRMAPVRCGSVSCLAGQAKGAELSGSSDW
ncbi:hypothetical protein ACQ4WX_49550 [Streptomyces lasalocidi]